MHDPWYSKLTTTSSEDPSLLAVVSSWWRVAQKVRAGAGLVRAWEAAMAEAARMNFIFVYWAGLGG